MELDEDDLIELCRIWYKHYSKALPEEAKNFPSLEDVRSGNHNYSSESIERMYLEARIGFDAVSEFLRERRA